MARSRSATLAVALLSSAAAAISGASAAGASAAESMTWMPAAGAAAVEPTDAATAPPTQTTYDATTVPAANATSPRGSPGWLRQVSFLSDENRRLRLEVAGLHDTLRSQSAEALAEKRRLLEAELRAAELRQQAAESEAVRAAAEARRAAAAAKAAEIEKQTAVEATEAARRTLEERRVAAEMEAKTWEQRRLVAETEVVRAQAEANVTHVKIQQLQLENTLTTARIQEAANIRQAKEAEAAAAIAGVESETQRRRAEETRLLVAQAEKERLEAEGAMRERLEAARVEAEEKSAAAAERRRELAAIAEEERARRRDAERLAAEEASVARREAVRIESDGALARLRAQLEVNATADRVDRESAARVAEERATEDIRARAAAAAATAAREQLIAGIAAAGAEAQSLVRTLLSSDARKLVAVVAGLLLLLPFARAGASGLQRALAQWVAPRQPVLVRDTSRANDTSIISLCRRRLCCCLRVLPRLDDAAIEALLDGVVLPAESAERITSLARSMAYSRVVGLPLRHAMFYGPPGTGKTMVAQRLAHSCGMEWATISGGDVAPLGDRAVTELNALMEWCNATPNGMCLFIDEAEAFLAARGRRSAPTSESGEAGGAASKENVMSVLLHHTGAPSRKLMLVLATNRPQDLDPAIVDRLDEHILLDLPTAENRVTLGRHFFHRHIGALAALTGAVHRDSPLPDAKDERVTASDCYEGDAGKSRLLRIECAVTLPLLDEVSRSLDGLSGRQLEKFFIGLQAATLATANGSSGPLLTVALLRRHAEQYRRQLSIAARWGGRVVEPRAAASTALPVATLLPVFEESARPHGGDTGTAGGEADASTSTIGAAPTTARRATRLARTISRGMGGGSGDALH